MKSLPVKLREKGGGLWSINNSIPLNYEIGFGGIWNGSFNRQNNDLGNSSEFHNWPLWYLTTRFLRKDIFGQDSPSNQLGG